MTCFCTLHVFVLHSVLLYTQHNYYISDAQNTEDLRSPTAEVNVTLVTHFNEAQRSRFQEMAGLTI